MREFFIVTFGLMLVVGCAGQKHPVNPIPTPIPPVTSPSSAYGARTDGAFIPLPNPLPSVGDAHGAGNCITEPGYQTVVCRATDIATENASKVANEQQFSTCCGGWADINTWNADSSMYLVENAGGGVMVMGFDAASGKSHPLSGVTLRGGGVSSWSHSDPHEAFGLAEGKSPEIDMLSFAAGSLSPTRSVIADLATEPNCVPSLTDVTQWKELSVDRSDSRFVVAAGTGAQGSANWVIVWDVAKGCRWWNTATGQIGGNWGPQGQASYKPSFLMHSVRISGDGQTVMAGPSNANNRVFWNVSTLDATTSGHVNNGHFATGFSGIITNASRSADGKWCKYGQAYHPFPSLIPDLFLIPARAQCFDMLVKGDDHQSWNEDDASDKQPVFDSTVTIPLGTPATVAWQNEILAFSVTQPGKVWREASTYNTGKSPFFSCSQAIGTVSQDGKFFMFTSDWGGTLGKDAAGRPRCDVFVARLH